MNQLQLEFISFEKAHLREAVLRAVKTGAKTLCLRPFNQLAASIALELLGLDELATIQARDIEPGLALPQGVEPFGRDTPPDITVLCEEEPQALSSLLMEYADDNSGFLIAPITPYYFRNRPLFLLSIPKAGTHLLFNLVKTFGYEDGVICSEMPAPGSCYCVMGSNTHTTAHDFFIEKTKDSPYGNKAHPFLHSPALLIYRNPLDILVSEADWFGKEGNSPLYNYLGHLSPDERLCRLIDDPELLGSIRDRTMDFAPWLDCTNVIPLSYEEIVGTQGGGNSEAQRKLIWSLQLKLHVPGDPTTHGAGIYDQDSPTFFKGSIGRYLKSLDQKTFDKAQLLPQDFMTRFGYDVKSLELPAPFPAYANKFLTRPLECPEPQSLPPFVVDTDFYGYNIVKYKKKFYGIHISSGDTDITMLREEQLSDFPASFDIGELRQIIRQMDLFLGSRIVKSGGKYYGVPVARKDINPYKLSPQDRELLPNADSPDSLKQILFNEKISAEISEKISAEISEKISAEITLKNLLKRFFD
jgi:hypothetical protein